MSSIRTGRGVGRYALVVTDSPHPRAPLSGAARTALASVGAAAALIAIKLIAGLGANSLALISEAIHSGVDLVAALLAFLALRVAGRPADADHPYGHGKTEHLSAFLEGIMLLVASGGIIFEAISRLGGHTSTVKTSPWVFGVIALVILIDATRAVTSWRGARRHHSAALAAGAVHFASDFAGTFAVLVGLLFVNAGYPSADAIAALVVAVLVVAASVRLLRRNADILLDRASPTDVALARAAVESLGDIEVRRLRLRSAAGRHFVDVIVAVPPAAALEQAHAIADRVEAALDEVLPGVDAIVHVEPGDGSLIERVRAAAQGIANVHEVHNVQLLEVDGRTEATLHLKLSAHTPLGHADATAQLVQHAILERAPEISAVSCHVEPLTQPRLGARLDQDPSADQTAALNAAVVEDIGVTPTDIRIVALGSGVVAFLTLILPAEMPLDEAHELAARARRVGRSIDSQVTDVFVTTRPDLADERRVIGPPTP